MKKYTKEQTDLITVDSFPELSYKKKKMFLAANRKDLSGSGKYLKALIKSEGSGVYNKLREKFCDVNYREKILSSLTSKGITCVTVKDDDYPDYLRQTPVPPLVLYCKGDLSLLNGECFAVVGSRRTLPAILALGEQTAENLARHFTIVTGVADGADSAAIRGGLKGGKIICVIPNGFDYLYPADNRRLIKNVEEAGLLVTEYPPDVPPQKFNFSMRNRIIAGLSRGTLVISAAKRSGALITANYAAEYGRDVFAFPYGIGVTSGAGCNAIIKKGASLAENAFDIFSAFGLEFTEKKDEELSPPEREVLSYLRESGESHLEKISAAVGKRTFETAAVCASLEIKGLAVKTGGNKYAAVK